MLNKLYRVNRLVGNPIIGPDILPADVRLNIVGPSLIKVPNWVPDPLGAFYLYFASHHGSVIHLAYARHLSGPWTLYAPGSLSLAQVAAKARPTLQPIRRQGIAHVASPDVHVDNVRREIRMYFHAKLTDLHVHWPHHTGVAVSKDGINFTLSHPGPVGRPYFRVFHYDGYFYAVSRLAQLQRSVDGIHWHKAGNSNFMGLAADHLVGAYPRHVAVILADDELTVFYTRIGDEPERILASTVRLKGEWYDWRLSAPVEVMRPQADYEGANLPVQRSKPGASYAAEHALRDPGVYRGDEGIYLLYACRGEVGGIAFAELL